MGGTTPAQELWRFHAEECTAAPSKGEPSRRDALSHDSLTVRTDVVTEQFFLVLETTEIHRKNVDALGRGALLAAEATCGPSSLWPDTRAFQQVSISGSKCGGRWLRQPGRSTRPARHQPDIGLGDCRPTRYGSVHRARGSAHAVQ